MFSKIKNKILNLSVFKLFLSLLITNVLFIGLAIIFYQGKFIFWEYPFSYAGMIKTVSGAENMISSYFYSAAMIISALIMFILAYHFHKNQNEQKNIRATISFVCGSGFLIAGLSPDDIRHGFHVLGSALFVSMLWILATNYVFEVRKKLIKFKFYLTQAVIQIPIFTYAGLFFADSEPAASITQKFALLGLVFATLYSTYYLTGLKKTLQIQNNNIE